MDHKAVLESQVDCREQKSAIYKTYRIYGLIMAGQSISAHADAETVNKLRGIAAREGRTPSQVTAASLKLYLDLPGTVRAALRDVDALGTPEDRHNLLRAIARTVASTQYEIARRRVAEGMRLDHENELDTDEAILAEAVRATAARR